MKKKIFRIISSLIIILSLNNCSEDFIDKAPLDSVSPENYFITEDGLLAGIDGCYEPFGEEGFNGKAYWMIGDGASDDAQPGGADADYRPIDEFTCTPNEGRIFSIWEALYKVVNLVNNIVIYVDDADAADEVKNKVEGQGLFLRAFAYFNLVRIFGDVPLLTEPANPEAQPARTPAEDVYDQIIADLERAAEILPLRSQYDSEYKGRPSKGSAQALLAKVYLTKAGNWNYMFDEPYGPENKDPEYFQKCLDMCREVISSNEYSLMQEFGDNFKLGVFNQAEAVFQLHFAGCTGRHGAGNMLQAFYPPFGQGLTGGGDGWGTNNPTSDLYYAFVEMNDSVRLRNTLFVPYKQYPEYITNIDGKDTTYWYPKEFISADYPLGDTAAADQYLAAWIRNTAGVGWKKYVVGPGDNVCDMSGAYPTQIIRYSDVLLMAAEAACELGSVNDAEIMLNMVRTRAQLPDITGLSQDELRIAIYKERRVEFAGEMHRWFDLLRTGRALEVMNHHWQNRDVASSAGNVEVTRDELLFPIPRREIDLNNNLEQNEGYN